jgi:hypothetical protein
MSALEIVSAEEIAQKMLALCEEGASQREASEKMSRELDGLSRQRIREMYRAEVPADQRPDNGPQAGRRAAERKRREQRDAQHVTVRCAGCGEVVYDGPLGKSRCALPEHRETCSAALPEYVAPDPMSLAPRGAMVPGAALALA